MITLKTLPYVTAQEVFDQVAVHLLTQNQKAMSASGSYCVYHANNNLMCAAGCLISDDEYTGAFEDNGWLHLVQHNKVPKNHSELIDDMQTLHDENNPEDWKRELIVLADIRKLNDDVINSFEEVK